MPLYNPTAAAVAYHMAGLSADAGNRNGMNGSIIPFDTALTSYGDGITFNAGTSKWTLTAGGIYELFSSLKIDAFSGAWIELGWEWYDYTAAALIGSYARMYDVKYAAASPNPGNQGMAYALIRPAVATDVGVQQTEFVNAPKVQAGGANNQSWAAVRRIG